ncbi:MAG: hypothetical protein K2M55_06995 [Muribaculaceae bacterium]|nr:hypothetical protein [Muribaculaceae bacterium]
MPKPGSRRAERIRHIILSILVWAVLISCFLCLRYYTLPTAPSAPAACDSIAATWTDSIAATVERDSTADSVKSSAASGRSGRRTDSGTSKPSRRRTAPTSKPKRTAEPILRDMLGSPVTRHDTISAD